MTLPPVTIFPFDEPVFASAAPWLHESGTRSGGTRPRFQLILFARKGDARFDGHVGLSRFQQNPACSRCTDVVPAPVSIKCRDRNFSMCTNSQMADDFPTEAACATEITG